MAYVLGVDLGTTDTSAATLDAAGPTMLGLGNRAMQVPSVIYLQPDGVMLFGEAAQRRGAADPARVARDFKRRIGDPAPIMLAGRPYPAEQLTALLLRWVVDQATDRMGESPATITLTHPAGWNRVRLDLLWQAVGTAALPPLTFCPEPVAAAGWYATRNRVRDGERICVYDLGGGIFDVGVLARDGQGFRFVGPPGGIDHLGGVDFDEAILRRVLGELRDDPQAPALLGDPAALARLRRDCLEAKEALSFDTDTLLPIALGGTGRSIRLTRAELEDLIRPALSQTVAETREVLQAAGVSPADISTFVLVGGSSRIPLVAELLAAEFGRPTTRDANPQHDVALGAALVAGRSRPTRVPAGPGPAGPAAPVAALDPGPPARRNRIVIAAVVAAVVVAVVALAATVFALTRTSGGEPIAAGTSSSVASSAAPASSASTGSASSSATTSASPSLLPLPRSIQPLADSIVITPRVVEGNLDLALVDSSSGQTVGLLSAPGGSAAAPAVAPDRRSIIYVADSPRLHVIAADGSGDRELFADLPGCEGRMLRPGWNPADPDEVALVCVDGQEKYLLRIVRVDGTVLRTLDVGQQVVDDLTFSPDGSQVAFWAGPGGGALDGGAVYTMPADGSGPPVRITDGQHDADPVWSPDGTEIVFRRYVDDGVTAANYEIALIRPDGSDLRILAPHAGDDIDPAWSPDGKQIVWKSNRGDGPTDVGFNHHLVMNADGSTIHRLAPTNPFPEEQAPAWGNR